MAIHGVSTKTMRRTLAGALVASLVSAASADVIGMMFTIEASVPDVGSAYWSIEVPAGYGSTFDWALDKPIELWGADKYGKPHLYGKLLDATAGYIADPVVGLGFLAEAGALTTNFTISSALLAFAPINPAQARASASIGVTDGGFDGVVLLGGHTDGSAYLAQVNGFVPGGTTFVGLIPGVAAGPGGVNSVFVDHPGGGAYLNIGGPIVDMSTSFKFSLSPFDQANGTSVFEVIPEPAALMSMALVGLALLRRRG